VAKLHILLGTSPTSYQLVIHVPVPTGSNAVGATWKAALLASGISGSTMLVTGTGLGQITAAEAADITAGDVIEIVTDARVESGGATPASLNEMANKATAAYQDRVKRQLKFYGYTQG